MKEEDFKRKTEKYEVIKGGFLQLQVCSPLPPDKLNEILEDLQKNYPSGTMNNWQKGEFEPAKCKEKEGHWHYVFIC